MLPETFETQCDPYAKITRQNTAQAAFVRSSPQLAFVRSVIVVSFSFISKIKPRGRPDLANNLKSMICVCTFDRVYPQSAREDFLTSAWLCSDYVPLLHLEAQGGKRKNDKIFKVKSQKSRLFFSFGSADSTKTAQETSVSACVLFRSWQGRLQTTEERRKGRSVWKHVRPLILIGADGLLSCWRKPKDCGYFGERFPKIRDIKKKKGCPVFGHVTLMDTFSRETLGTARIREAIPFICTIRDFIVVFGVRHVVIKCNVFTSFVNTETEELMKSIAFLLRKSTRGHNVCGF